MTKSLESTPRVHSRVRTTRSQLGMYTEVGAGSYLENTKLGDFSYCGENCIFQNTEILKFSNIAAAVRIGPTDHPIDRPTLHHFTYRRKLYGLADTDDEEFFRQRESRITVIGHDTWIGHGAIIMPGLTVGHGSVVGSGAVVTRNIPPYSIAVGVPARVVKNRFSPEIVRQLLFIAWWNWSWLLIKERHEDFRLPIEEFVAKYSGEEDL